MPKGTLFRACLLACTTSMLSMAASAESVASTVPLKQNWVKRGLVFAPGFAGPSSSKFVSSPSVVRLKDGRLRVYVWAADGTPPWLNGRHVILAAENDSADPHKWKVISKEAMVGPGTGGSIRDRGVGFPHVLPREDGPWLMYFSNWGGDWTIKQQLMNRLGLATSDDQGLTWKVVKEDMLPSGPPGSFDAGAIPSAVVLQRGKDDYLMWYTTAEKYLRFGAVNQGILNIGAARSRDGINWEKIGPALRARVGDTDPYETGLARPAVLKLDGVYHMWVGAYDMAPGSRPQKNTADSSPSPAGTNRAGAGSYRIEYARSKDGVSWTRFTDQPVIPLTPGGFDSTSQTYASVVDMGEQLWLFYAGDGLGNTGVGLATLAKNELRPE
jgi:hypothetical protein